MIELRRFEELGAFRNEWLDSRFHFSFAEYHDPARMGWGSLRVWNDDRIRPGAGFDMHPHSDMEIITYVRHGAITHEDNLGNRGVTQAGDVQVMTAGTGVLHSEYNHGTEDATLFQIWILPAEKALTPGWATRAFPAGRDANRLVVMASGRAGDTDALPIHQDGALLAATLEAGCSVGHVISPGRHVYLVPASGAVDVNGVRVDSRAGAAITDEGELAITAVDDSEIVLVDVP